MTTNTYNAATINIYQMPESGATVIFSDGSKWTMKQNGRFEWGLYDTENSVLHSAVGSHCGMVEFCAAINQQDQFLKDLLGWKRGD